MIFELAGSTQGAGNMYFTGEMAGREHGKSFLGRGGAWQGACKPQNKPKTTK